MTQSLAAATQAAAPSDNNLRTGTVVAVNSTACTADVTVGGVLFPGLVYLYTPVPPAVGSTVAVFRQETSWFVVGMLTGKTPAEAAVILRGLYGQALGLNYGNVTWRESGTGGTIASGTTALIPGTSSRTITKAYIPTRLRIIQSICVFPSNINNVIEFGLRFSGGFTTTDVYVGTVVMNPVALFSGVGMTVVDSVVIPVVVGVVTMAPIWKRTIGTGTITFDSTGRSCVTVDEVP